jgi:glycerate dehydrogenase
MKNKIVFLDAGTVDYGDLPLKAFSKLGAFKAWFNTKPSQIAGRLRDAEIAVVNKVVLGADVIGRLDRLRCIAVAATGVNNVDLEAARKKGIAVLNVKGYSTESVVQCTFSFILALAGNLVKYNEASHSGKWGRSKFFMLSDFRVSEIHGKTLGIVGYGAIGSRVAEIARAFGMKVLVAGIPGRKYSAREGRVPLNRVAAGSDFLTVHAPLSSLTRNLIDARILRKMKKTACVVNMARGGIVDEKALARALKTGRIAGAASDVLTQEPPSANHVLLRVPNMLLTPHVAWASFESRKRLVNEIIMNLEAFLKGEKRNRVV